MIQTVRVRTRGPDPIGAEVTREILNTLRIKSVTAVKTVKVFRLEGVDEIEARVLAEKLLVEPIEQDWAFNAPLLTDATICREVAYKPGVMNPEVASILKAARDLRVTNLVAADSSFEYHFYGHPTDGEISKILTRLLVNKTVQQVVERAPQTLIIHGTRPPTELVAIRQLSPLQLEKLSTTRRLFLNTEEMLVIQSCFRDLRRDPTDAELEEIAQVWSEHCGHKTTNARIIAAGVEKQPIIKRLRETAEKYYGNLVVSAFEDNSGVIRVNDKYGVNGKVETHNSPSAAEPYGGANTGTGGVLRDVNKTGKGAKVILSTDIFCLASPDLPWEMVPPGCLHPSYLFRRVIAGVRDFGNRTGVPTADGSVHFHDGFRAKPSIIVGAYGIIPLDKAKKGQSHTGDLIVAVGGRTGRDGIHGATFSSGAMDANTSTVDGSAVQIGNAIEQKRADDALLVCRDEDLIEEGTDCGAGGFSSAIGEMADGLGAIVYLDRAPLKYPGLAAWEILLSESQERYVLAVNPRNVARFIEICRLFNVEATVLGEFTDDNRIVIMYDRELVADLSLEFLYHGLPQRTMVANWHPPITTTPDPPPPDNWEETWATVMTHGNVCSKEPIVRMYDHGVQGSSALPPFTGVHMDGPCDAVVLAPFLEEKYRYNGVVVSHGLHPALNLLNPYWGSLWAGVEALANYVAVGGDFRRAALIDNYIWPFPDEDSMGALDMATDALVDLMNAFREPFVSGKDSLSSTYKFPDGTIVKIPPVMCISAFGGIKDVRKTISADFKRAGSNIVLLGRLHPQQMGGSAYFDTLGLEGGLVPKVALSALPRRFARLHRLIESGKILACHDISEGGLAATLAEMCFGGGVGAILDLTSLQGRLDHLLFNEMAGCFLLEADDEFLQGGLLHGIPHEVIGLTVRSQDIEVHHNGRRRFNVQLDLLKQAWQAPMKEVFG